MIEQLSAATRAVTNPQNYFGGTGESTVTTPHNVIVFNRLRSSELGMGKSYHHRFVLIVCCETEGSVIVDDRSFRLVPGLAVLVFPHQFHHFMDFAASHVSWLFVTFEMRSPDDLLPLRYMPVALPEASQRWFLELALSHRLPHKASTSDNNASMLVLGLALNNLLETAQSSPSAGRQLPRAPHDTRIDRVNRYVARHLGEDLSLRQLARRFAISESHLRLLYRRTTGMSLGGYITQMRVNRASGLLMNSDLNVTQVAEECGYDSVYSFSRAFKRMVGASPRKYRRERSRGNS